MTAPTGCCCCCCGDDSHCQQPYLTTRNSQGEVIGQTKFICDECLCVPKFHITNRDGQVKYLLRPDTCCGGICVMPRWGGRRGKCCRVPFLIRDPSTYEPISTSTSIEDGEENAQITFLWSGLVNEACYKRHAYHIAFPQDSTPEDRLTLIGSSILVDVALYEHDDDNNGGS